MQRKALSFTSANARVSQGFPDSSVVWSNTQLSIAGLAAPGVKRRIGAFLRAPLHRNPPDDAVVCVRADDGCGDLPGAVAVEPRRAAAKRGQGGGRLHGTPPRR